MFHEFRCDSSWFVFDLIIISSVFSTFYRCFSACREVVMHRVKERCLLSKPECDTSNLQGSADHDFLLKPVSGSGGTTGAYTRHDNKQCPSAATVPVPGHADQCYNKCNPTTGTQQGTPACDGYGGREVCDHRVALVVVSVGMNQTCRRITSSVCRRRSALRLATG